jgi:hypothetical protein
MSQYSSLVPLGTITITAIGATVALSVNCGNYGGQGSSGSYVPGNAWRGMEITADPGNSGNIYLLPRGKTAAANPEAIFAKIGPGGSLSFPNSSMAGVGILPENFCLDTDAAAGVGYKCVAWGYGTIG